MSFLKEPIRVKHKNKWRNQGERTDNLCDLLKGSLQGGDLDSGRLENLSSEVSTLREALASVIELLVSKKQISRKQVAELCGYYDASVDEFSIIEEDKD